MATELWAKVVHIFDPGLAPKFGSQPHVPVDAVRPCSVEYFDNPPRALVRCTNTLTAEQIAECAKYGAYPTKDGLPTWGRDLRSAVDAQADVVAAMER